LFFFQLILHQHLVKEKFFSVEMHHKVVESATTGDNCGFNIKGLVKENMPRVGDIMILKKR